MRTLLVLTILLGIPFASRAQSPFGAIHERTDEVTNLFQGDHRQIVHREFYPIVNSAQTTCAFRLERGVTYSVIVVGDGDRILDINGSVYDAQGALVGADADSANLSIVEVTPPVTQQYTVCASGGRFAAEANEAHFAILIVRMN